MSDSRTPAASPEGAEVSIHARTLAGCKRQFVEVLLFLPLLLGTIVVGIGVLVLNFWLANWKPSLLGGCISLFIFACTPVTAMMIWQRRRLQRNLADVVLTLKHDGIELSHLTPPRVHEFFGWEWIESSKSRNLSAMHKALTLVVHDPNQPSRRLKLDYALCAERQQADEFAGEVAKRLARHRSG